MTFLTSLRDALLVARFQLRRAMRTRSAMAVCALFILVAGGSSYGTTRLLHELERVTANVLGVPETDKPGALIEEVKRQEDFEQFFEEALGGPELVSWAMDLPILSFTHFWVGLALVPFLAVAVGAEAVAPDVRDRSVRFELLRTARLEWVTGRYLGQALLVLAATLLATLGTWVVAMTCMVGVSPVLQLTTLLEFAPRLWVWSLPFLGLGVACSQLTRNTNFARLLALSSATGSFILYGLVEGGAFASNWPLVYDIVTPLMPQTWIIDLWGPGLAWLKSGVVLVALGLAAALAGYPIFRLRNV